MKIIELHVNPSKHIEKDTGIRYYVEDDNGKRLSGDYLQKSEAEAEMKNIEARRKVK